MSAGLDLAAIRSSSAREVIPAVPPQSFNPTVMSRVEGRPVVRPPGQLRLHRALEELDWIGVIDEFNDVARLTNPSVSEPILITTNGTILAGFGSWRSAVLDRRQEINCIEYPLSEDQSLQFILIHHQTRRGWNDFVRIRLALTLEPIFSRRRSTTCALAASSRAWQICRRLSILMCAKRWPGDLIFQTEVVEQRFGAVVLSHHDQQASDDQNQTEHV
jgi:hypothetical protein